MRQHVGDTALTTYPTLISSSKQRKETLKVLKRVKQSSTRSQIPVMICCWSCAEAEVSGNRHRHLDSNSV